MDSAPDVAIDMPEGIRTTEGKRWFPFFGRNASLDMTEGKQSSFNVFSLDRNKARKREFVPYR